jgi:hypothetical protein
MDHGEAARLKLDKVGSVRTVEPAIVICLGAVAYALLDVADAIREAK